LLFFLFSAVSAISAVNLLLVAAMLLQEITAEKTIGAYAESISIGPELMQKP